MKTVSLLPSRMWRYAGMALWVGLFGLVFLLANPGTLLAQDSTALSDNGQVVLDAVNRVRAENGLSPLALNPTLTLAAQLHVADMAGAYTYSHTGSDGSSVAMRAARAGYASKRGVSENWVATQNAAGAMAWWMNSYVHRANILNPKWRDIGVGAQRDPDNGMLLCVLVFGGGNDGNPGVVVAASAPSPTVPAGGMAYIVQPGDTLSGIATRFGVDWQHVAAANGLGEDSMLQIGQSIHLPGINEGLAASGTSAYGTASYGTGGISDDAPEYMVQSGDTLVTIAAHYGLTWQEVAAANGLYDGSVLQIGQLLRIPGQVAAAKSGPVSAAPRMHVVRTGETVISIALTYGLDWHSLLSLNGLSDSSVLQIGQQLRLN